MHYSFYTFNLRHPGLQIKVLPCMNSQSEILLRILLDDSSIVFSTLSVKSSSFHEK